MQDFVVTGGAGFIGSKIVRKLISQGHRVTIVDNLKTGVRENIAPEADFFEIGVENFEALELLPQRPYHAVLHLAAQASGEISHDDPIYDLESNAKGTLNLLRFAHSRGIKRFLNASSMGVYGQVPEIENPVSENRPPNPLSFYGVTKTAGEGYCTYFKSQGMKITSFRMFNVYGPGQNLDNMRQGMVSIYLAYILKNEPIVVKGSKNRFRDFIFVDDVVNAWMCAIDNPHTFDKNYNIATGKKTQVFQLIENLLTVFGKDPKTYPVQFGESTPGDQTGIFADISSYKKDGNWFPTIDLKEGLTRLKNELLPGN